MAVEDEVTRAVAPLRGRVLGVMLWGSHAHGSPHARSDVDVCVVAGAGRDLEEVASLVRREVQAPGLPLDVRVFEHLPLYLQGAVIDADRVLYAEDAVALYAYLRPWRRLWDDQKHRARSVTAEDVRRAFARG